MALEPGQVEHRRGWMPAVLQRLRNVRVVVIGHAPDEQPEQPDDESDRKPLCREPDRSRHQEATMKTVVPILTWLNNHSACGMCIRMQPCDTE